MGERSVRFFSRSDPPQSPDPSTFRGFRRLLPCPLIGDTSRELLSAAPGMVRESAPILVIGFGNPLVGDDGLGLAALRQLELQYQLPEQVEVLDGGTSSIGLYELLGNRELLLIIDAVVTDDPPGTIVRLCDDQIPSRLGKPLSPHQLDLSDTLALMLAAGDCPEHVCVLGIVPFSAEFKGDISSDVGRSLDELVRMIVRELRDVGVTLERQAGITLR